MRLSHIALAVKPEDYDNIKNVFEKILKVSPEERVLRNENIKVTLYKLENCSLEIITPVSEDSNIDKFLKKRGNGIHHFALMVENVKKEVDNLKSFGFNFAVESMKGAKGGNVAFLHPKSTGGFLIELVEDEY